MIGASRAILFATLLLTGVAQALAAPPLPKRSLSTSRQFVVYGLTVELRGAVGELAERMKRSVLDALGQRDEWRTPIILNVQFPQTNVPELANSRLYVSQTGAGLKLQLDLTITPEVDTIAVERELLRAIFVELIYRNHSDIPAGTVYSDAPPWLIDGFLARQGGVQNGTLNDLLASAADSNKVMSLEDFLQQKPEQLDGQARLLYSAYSAALLQFLLDQPSGPTHVRAFVESLARSSNDPLGDLRAQFPEMGRAETVDILWKSAVARFASTRRFEFLFSFAETERQLDEVLHMPVPNPASRSKPFALEQMGETKPSKMQVMALRAIAQRLQLLTASSHPLLRPIVREYQDTAQLLSTGKSNKRVRQRLTAAHETRQKIARRMGHIDDYMNWFEATQLQTNSGAFRGYLKAAQEPAAPEKRRRDPLSVYLDAVEQELQN